LELQDPLAKVHNAHYR